MTSPAEPASTDATQARQLTKPLRELAALALLGANAVFLFVGLLRLIAPNDYSSFTDRAGSAFYSFIGVEAVALPLLAVLLATHISPVLPKAKLITQVALVEYAVSAFFGTLTMLIWTVGRLAQAEILDALLGVLTRFAWMVVFAVAAWVVYTVWRAHYYVPRPKPQPGVYGQPQPGQPHPGWPQQQGGWPAPGQPGGQQQGGWPSAGQPGGYPPAQYPGQFGQPSPPFQAAPQSAPPFPQSAPPVNPAPPSPAAPPFGQPPSADPTQAIPRQPADSAAADRTQAIAHPDSAPADPTQAITRPTDSDDDRTQHIKPGEHPDQPR
ncbi:hypothetical protein GCM10028790_48010 [Micromonospora taraxaci]|uniref:Uncharacterized protein n=1 Tax=Micromonospora taraxaci TaxID=1316803 RepID=A0A561VF00_9ACTN|nr:hypothetical protein [Micromonospora taraxaci]TWG10195.1 hypothetical protein FHU34_12649 [Micromonospora taraxaci]